MTVREIKNEMVKLERYGYKDLDVQMFAHDHDDEKLDEGVGSVFSINLVEQENGNEIISLRP